MASRLNGETILCLGLAVVLSFYPSRNAQGQENPNMLAPGYAATNPPAPWAANLPFTDAPVPAQIVSARRVFVANLTGNVITGLSGGPDRNYNQLYAALRSWGRFELTSAPAAADVVLEISQVFLRRVPSDRSQDYAGLRITIVDPKTNVALWRLDQPIEPAVWEKNQEKNYNLAMTALVNRLKALTEAPAAQAGNTVGSGPSGTSSDREVAR